MMWIDFLMRIISFCFSSLLGLVLWVKPPGMYVLKQYYRTHTRGLRGTEICVRVPAPSRQIGRAHV